MTAESDRLERAGRYVLGLMDATERSRAERDLEFDAAFRAAVVGVAERMHLFDLGGTNAEAPSWKNVAGAIAAMPHMRAVSGAVVERENGTPPPQPPPARRPRPPADPDLKRRTLAILAFAILAFVVGYLTGYVSAR
ncbi:MAG: hypothetical protein KF723_09530 [Rhizobiaceae bacterium]|nr:hypothetical protein [Rhizobiaceae bacterium]